MHRSHGPYSSWSAPICPLWGQLQLQADRCWGKPLRCRGLGGVQRLHEAGGGGGVAGVWSGPGFPLGSGGRGQHVTKHLGRSGTERGGTTLRRPRPLGPRELSLCRCRVSLLLSAPPPVSLCCGFGGLGMHETPRAQSAPSTLPGPRLRAVVPARPCPPKAATGIQGTSVVLGLRGPSPTPHPRAETSL